MGRSIHRDPPPCLHCLQRVAWKARGLCNVCYKDPAVKASRPPLSFAEGGRIGGRKNKGRTRGNRDRVA